MLTISDILMLMMGMLLSTLLLWVRMDIKAQREETRELGKALRSEMSAGFESQRSATNLRFDGVDRRFNRIDRKLDSAGEVSRKQGERIVRLEWEAGIPTAQTGEATSSAVGP